MQTVIVLGTHNSGSGLIHDYLSSRSDCNSPFNHNEFRICTDPRGLNYLYNNCYKNDGFFNSSHAVSEFLNYIEQVQNHKTHLSKNIHQKINNGDRILVHCRGGCGRTGMIVLRIMIEFGEDPDEALKRLRKIRPCAVETNSQENWARLFGTNNS